MAGTDLEQLRRIVRDQSDLDIQAKRVAKYLKRATPTVAAGRLLGAVIGNLPDNLSMLRRGGQFFVELQDWPRAATLLERAVAMDGAHLKTRLRLVSCYMKQGLWESARMAMEPVTRHPRVIWRHFLQLAEIHSHLGNETQRLDNLRQAFAASPRNPELQRQLIAAAETAGDDSQLREIVRSIREVPAKLSAAAVLERIAQCDPDGMSRFIVNIGCRDGRSWDDPCYELFNAGFAGLAVDAGNFPAIFQNLPRADVSKQLDTPITPINVVDVLRKAKTPVEFDLLHLNIGCLEGSLLDPILEVYRPKVIHLAVNTEIPPPVKFAVEYHPDLRGGAKAGFWGCSVSYATATTHKYGYALLQLDFSDQSYRRYALLIRTQYLAAFGRESLPEERSLYDAEPYTPGRFLDIGVDTRKWRKIRNADELLAEIRSACERASIERSGSVLPFVLTL